MEKRTSLAKADRIELQNYKRRREKDTHVGDAERNSR